MLIAHLTTTAKKYIVDFQIEEKSSQKLSNLLGGSKCVSWYLIDTCMKDDLFISKQSCIIRYKHKTPVYMLVIRLQ